MADPRDAARYADAGAYCARVNELTAEAMHDAGQAPPSAGTPAAREHLDTLAIAKSTGEPYAQVRTRRMRAQRKVD